MAWKLPWRARRQSTYWLVESETTTLHVAGHDEDDSITLTIHGPLTATALRADGVGRRTLPELRLHRLRFSDGHGVTERLRRWSVQADGVAVSLGCVMDPRGTIHAPTLSGVIADLDGNVLARTAQGSPFIRNKAQVRATARTLNELESLDVKDLNLRGRITQLREYYAEQTKTTLKLSFWRVVLGVIALWFLGSGILSFPRGLIAGESLLSVILTPLVGALLSLWFWRISFAPVYLRNAARLGVGMTYRGLGS
jgi:hypothetical protein